MTYFYVFHYFGLGDNITLGVMATTLTLSIIYMAFYLIEMIYAAIYNRPLYAIFYFHKRSLSPEQLDILSNKFSFYKKLDKKHQKYFEHRVASFIKSKSFVGRDGVVISDELMVLISSTACMLTFGFRNYSIDLINHIFIYPKEFYSITNGKYHKGEFNPKLKILVLSWKDFEEGFRDSTSNKNLGIHEFAHAIHLNCLKKRDVNSIIFRSSFDELMEILVEKKLRKRLIKSHYLRNYAFTDQFEFIAVSIESFIESPKEFKSKFPNIYSKIKQMLNFNFAGY